MNTFNPAIGPIGMINAVLFILFISAIITDLKSRSIYNAQTYTGIVLGLLLGFSATGWNGLMMSFTGCLVGFFLLFFIYILGGIGAGDVKLLAAIGALKGTEFVLWTMFYTALVGGIMALSIIIWQGTFRQTIKSCFQIIRHPVQTGKEPEKHQYLPYGVAISLGCLWAFCTL